MVTCNHYSKVQLNDVNIRNFKISNSSFTLISTDPRGYSSDPQNAISRNKRLPTDRSLKKKKENTGV